MAEFRFVGRCWGFVVFPCLRELMCNGCGVSRFRVGEYKGVCLHVRVVEHMALDFGEYPNPGSRVLHHREGLLMLQKDVVTFLGWSTY